MCTIAPIVSPALIPGYGNMESILTIRSTDSQGLCPGFGRVDLPYCGIHVVDQLPYCEAHRCQAPGCVKVKDVNIRIAWCEDHMCGKAGCEERRRDGGS